MKKVYVAGKFEDKETILKVYEELRKIGYEISYDWTTHKPIKPYPENPELATQYSEEEMSAIENSDVFIYLSSKTGTTSKMEVGAAMNLKHSVGKPSKIYIVGEFNDASPWFINPIVSRKDNVEEVLAELKDSGF